MQAIPSEDATLVATLTAGGILRLWTNTLSAQASVFFQVDHVHQIALNRAHSRLLTVRAASSNQEPTEVQLWDVAHTRPIGAPLREDAKVVLVEFAEGAPLFAIGTADGGVQVRSSEDGAAVSQTLHQPGVAACVAFSPDSKRLLTAGVDTTYSPTGTYIWDYASGKNTVGPLMHYDGVHLVCFSPDGQWAATCGEDAAARIWDVTTGEPLTPRLMHHNRVLTLAFSPDGKRLATGSVDGEAHVWNSRRGEPLTPALQHQNRVLKVAFLPDGSHLLTVSADGMIRLWDISKTEESLDDLSLQTQLLSSHRFDLQTGMVALDHASISNAWTRFKNH